MSILCGKIFKKYVINVIQEIGLTIEENKTNFYIFKCEEKPMLCIHETKRTRKILEYLGFSFDGNHILLKNSSVLKFYYKVHKAIRYGVWYATHT